MKKLIALSSVLALMALGFGCGPGQNSNNAGVVTDKTPTRTPTPAMTPATTSNTNTGNTNSGAKAPAKTPY